MQVAGRSRVPACAGDPLRRQQQRQGVRLVVIGKPSVTEHQDVVVGEFQGAALFRTLIGAGPEAFGIDAERNHRQ